MKRILLLAGLVFIGTAAFSQGDPLQNKMLAPSAFASKSIKPDVLINPNPVKGVDFNLELQNLEKGKYSIYIFAASGKKYIVKTLNYDGGSATEIVNLPKEIQSGTYILQVISKSARFIKKMVVE